MRTAAEFRRDGLACTVPAAWVYLLRCRDGSLYCGWTSDLDRRLREHDAGTASRYTSSRRPVELAASFETPDFSSARREEARIKRLSRRQKLALVDPSAAQRCSGFS
ncbi:MAG: putative endonuclease [Solirubrobacteraceae bacterium]|nr:putative endonuclease [Solirubrobacteraceae bacterium]